MGCAAGDDYTPAAAEGDDEYESPASGGAAAAAASTLSRKDLNTRKAELQAEIAGASPPQATGTRRRTDGDASATNATKRARK